MLTLYKLNDLAVDFILRIGGAGERSVAAEILIRHRFERHHVKIVAHTVAGYHCAGELGRLLDVIRCARRHLAENELLSGASARKRCNFILKLLLCQQIFVALIHLHCIAERAGGSGNYRYLLHGCRVRLHRRN